MIVKHRATQYLSISILIVLLIFTYLFTVGFTGVDSVYLGGMPVGVVQQCQGVVVADFIDVTTANGLINPAKTAGVLKGDLITAIDQKAVFSPSEVENLTTDASMVVTVMRGKDYTDISITPALDTISSQYKLGLALKNELSGVGTMTYVTQTKRFGAIGHKIYDKNISTEGAFPTGQLFSCQISGYDKSENYKIGSLRGVFNRQANLIGRVDKNIKFGMFGEIDTDFTNLTLIPVGKKEEIVLGKATFFTTISGTTPIEYDIEIIKIEAQNAPKEKSLIIKVTDQELIDKTGGILQGMSGSPIVQNGKLIGAVTHVFTSNAIYGYGIFIDWMLDN